MANGYLRTVPSDADVDDGRLDDPTFVTQYAGLRVYDDAAVKELCLVAEAGAPLGMGGVLKTRKGGVTYAVYLVETTDPNASHAYVRTTTGTKAIRLKT